jgi:hypothetical protein
MRKEETEDSYPSWVPLLVKITLHKLSPVHIREHDPHSTVVDISEDMSNMAPASASTL